jgi:hypothetical protein
VGFFLITYRVLLPVLIVDGNIEHWSTGPVFVSNSTSSLLMSLARVGRTSGIYTIRQSGISNLEASLDNILMPSMH